MTEITPQRPFDSIRRTDEAGKEFWYARELMPLLQYVKWQKFEDAIDRAKTSCEVAGFSVEAHFSHLPGAVSAKGRFGDNYRLTRYACHLIAMNGDVRKPAIASAQAYFSIKAVEAELSKQPQLPPVQQTIANVDALIGWIAHSDTEKNLLEQAKYDTVANIHPEYRPLLEAAKKVRSSQAVHQSVGLTPSQIGNQLDPIKKPSEVNEILEVLGFQFKQPKKKRGKDSHEWQLTEEGKAHGFVYFATQSDKWSGDQIRWQNSVIAVIRDYLLLIPEYLETEAV